MRPEIERARKVIPIGASSPLRACRNVEADPLVVAESHGQYLHDVDGTRYVDFMYGFGPLILGHAPETVSRAIARQAAKGTLFGTFCPQEAELAERITATAAHLEQLRFVCSGTEAMMSVVRLSRAYTGRTRIMRFTGGYHGHFDLVQNKDETRMRAAGLDPDAMRSNLVADYNDIESVERLFARHPGEIAAVCIEPVACNMSLVLPQPGFLADLRRVCSREGALLVFDEVITGFRLGFGPAGVALGVEPDLTAFGKIIGGGTPVGAFGGRQDVMALLDEERVLQGGTLAGNPLTMAAGLATLDVLAQPGFYEELERKGALLEAEIERHRAATGLDFVFTRTGSIFAFIFVPQTTAVVGKEDVAKQDRQAYTRLYAGMREAGYHLAPDVEEPMYLSAATTDETIKDFAERVCAVLAGTS
ncbi:MULTISPECIES: aspartate aminotransferase family protein [unclassified Streptomyces]|uniref:aspartate aminotransferase family protein n=1 Tax=unclassified Streptomyces TaxID=2593676 RepID=UPI0025570839|nr:MULTISPECIES: glutamate-1-semialdehyde 2,1-aminomutase [unclassified Streptomyces]WRZ65689.1 glutamate-1-semialdehyde 2,1-aminomutase [Streptomyces sp. NBC_01257]WSU59684.1 glutamate-1-semialdehyde 2,1-aminomutase [Streptomyces sp. NBC_01104]